MTGRNINKLGQAAKAATAATVLSRAAVGPVSSIIGSQMTAGASIRATSSASNGKDQSQLPERPKPARLAPALPEESRGEAYSNQTPYPPFYTSLRLHFGNLLTALGPMYVHCLGSWEGFSEMLQDVGAIVFGIHMLDSQRPLSRIQAEIEMQQVAMAFERLRKRGESERENLEKWVDVEHVLSTIERAKWTLGPDGRHHWPEK
ncbi:hypothetical protein NA57DRAFT_54682 [Rhizodiscina lignyota]|uniref:Uncharacterized protein n=1 Tax=Rhizodiscina lignyota TaxID=1504668 RepID=A0A9P4IGK0_9PEZI|nr:hypothetical protein NA57DRAFT_54682 [Rhizodiscina lignyota]